MTAAPDTSDLRCPLCNYNLHGLAEPRCPECGHTFQWSELTDPARQRLSWLFEHRRLLGGYVTTQLRLLWPPLFFRQLRPAHRIVKRRLLLFFVLSCLTCMPPLGMPYILFAMELDAWGRAFRQRVAENPNLLATYRSNPRWAAMSDAQILAEVAPRPNQIAFWEVLHQSVRLTWESFNPRSLRVLVAATMGLSTLLAAVIVLLVLRISLRRVQATPPQLFRLAIYLADPLPLTICLLAMLAQAIVSAFRSSGGRAVVTYQFGYHLNQATGPLLWIALAICGHFLLRYHAAARHYFGLKHSPLATLATAMIAFLLFAITMKYTGWWWLL